MFGLFKSKKLLVTHDGGFHADDVFACAILEIYLDKKGEGYEIVRTRDQKIIERADYVFDVGGVYDPSSHRFDHHQKGRAGARENGIMYAAAGLVWKHFGESLTGSPEAVQMIDQRIQALDAADNGQDIYKSLIPGVSPYIVPSIVGNFNLAWNEDGALQMKQFLKMVSWAKEIMGREILHVNVMLESEKDIRRAYEQTADKRVIVLDKPYSRYEILRVLVGFPEPIYFVYPKSDDRAWKAEAVRSTFEGFESRKPFPEAWRGLRDADFQKASGVTDAIFSHDGRFYCVAQTRDGAMALAKKALES